MHEAARSPSPSSRETVFLSHSGADAQAVRHLAEYLRRNGLDVWLDQDCLKPGDPWQPALEQAILKASAMVVYVGRMGVQNWVDREVRLGLMRNTDDPHAFRLIPVLGEGARPEALPPFLLQHQYVDLRDSRQEPEKIQSLIAALKNKEQRALAVPSKYWSQHSPFRSLQAFEPEDAWLFFGRDMETAELGDRLGKAPVLAIVGNSGSGKSSLVRAGLIPALQHGRFRWNGSQVRMRGVFRDGFRRFGSCFIEGVEEGPYIDAEVPAGCFDGDLASQCAP